MSHPFLPWLAAGLFALAVVHTFSTKFFEHFVLIAEALNELGLWCPDDKFFYDALSRPGAPPLLMRIQSVVGLTSLFAVSIINKKMLHKLPDFTRRITWFEKYRKRHGKYWPNEERADDDLPRWHRASAAGPAG